jgi:small-conductance mechanosensitive channel
VDVAYLTSQFEAWLGRAVLTEWTAYQIAVILGGYFVSVALASRTEPALERRAREIKGNPALLRVIVAFMRRMTWLYLAIWLWIADLALSRYVAEPERWLITTALTLAAGWFVISALTKIIRNATLSRFVAFAGWAYLALYALGLDQPVVTALDRAAITIGVLRLSLLLVVKAVLFTATLVWVAILLSNVFSHWIQRSSDLSPSFKVLIRKLVKIGLITAAGAIALSATGIDLTALTVFSGAVGVGIGFGLQKVVSNFISGIIILLDKSIKPGDTIALGDTFGSIRDLRSRFVSVLTRDGKEYLIPNEDFITEKVINWSFSDDYVRVDVDFGTSYDSDPHQVIKLAIETASAVPRVANTYKPPVCWMTAFGASSLDFRLRFWISDPANGLTNIRGQVLLALWDAFKEAEISIPYPTRELVVKEPIEIRNAQ